MINDLLILRNDKTNHETNSGELLFSSRILKSVYQRINGHNSLVLFSQISTLAILRIIHDFVDPLLWFAGDSDLQHPGQ